VPLAACKPPVLWLYEVCRTGPTNILDLQFIEVEKEPSPVSFILSILFILSEI